MSQLDYSTVHIFGCLFVCLFIYLFIALQDNSKSCGQSLMKFSG